MSVAVLNLNVCLLLLCFHISSDMNSMSDTCKLSYFVIVKLLECNFTAVLLISTQKSGIIELSKIMMKVKDLNSRYKINSIN